jgi:uncharacterized protein (DUF2132 family)
MSSTINQSMSLFIAYVFPNIGVHRIINIFQDANLGIVSRVDFIKKTDKNGKSFNNIYIHFHSWLETEEAQQFQDSIRDPEAKTTLQYDGPWFWIVLENTFIKKIKDKREVKKVKKVKDVNQNMYQSLPPITRKITLDLSEDPVIKQMVDPKMFNRIIAAAANPNPNPNPIQHKSNLFKHSYWDQPAEEILQEKTSALLAQILEIQKEHAQEIDTIKIEAMKQHVKVKEDEQNELEYLREQNRQLQLELDSIKEKKD